MTENIIRKKILEKKGDILNVYFTAGYPNLNDTPRIISLLEKEGVDLIELGMPYSDPLADGLTIQESSARALENGMSLDILFDQVSTARKTCTIPIIAMGYYNQLLQYGVERFLKKASVAGINGLIIPDIPMNVFEREYKELFSRFNISFSFLISPMTSEERIRKADELSSAFIYVVSKSSITGKQEGISSDQKAYFEKIIAMKLNSPTLIGFGIHDKKTYQSATKYSYGAIVGSAFIRAISQEGSLEENIAGFIKRIR
jgi:tryptophan synthase alpha chain